MFNGVSQRKIGRWPAQGRHAQIEKCSLVFAEESMEKIQLVPQEHLVMMETAEVSKATRTFVTSSAAHTRVLHPASFI